METGSQRAAGRAGGGAGGGGGQGFGGKPRGSPPAPRVPREAERTSRADDPAVKVEARRRPAPGAVGARRVDTPGQAGYAGVDHHTRPDRDRATGSGLDDAAAGLVPEDEGEGADG